MGIPMAVGGVDYSGMGGDPRGKNRGLDGSPLRCACGAIRGGGGESERQQQRRSRSLVLASPLASSTVGCMPGRSRGGPGRDG